MSNTRFFFLLVLFAIVLPQDLFSQYYLVLKKRSKIKYVFEAGESLKFKLHGEDFYTKQMIVGFGPNKIRFHYFELDLSEVSHLKVPKARKNAVSLFSRLTLTAGVLFIFLDQFNQGFVIGEGFGPSEETLIISGALVGTGLLLKLFQ